MKKTSKQTASGALRKKMGEATVGTESAPASTESVTLDCGIDFSGGVPVRTPVDMFVDLSTGETSESRRIPVNPKLVRRRHLRQLMVLMERPFFALAKRRAEPIEYSSRGQRVKVSVRPGPGGMATIWDADLMMFLVDQLARAPSGGGGTVVMKGSAYFDAIGLKRDGDQYRRLATSIERLKATTVTTNARIDGKPGASQTFAWIDKAIRQGSDWQIAVSDWVAERARSKFVLNVCPEYFDLGGVERFLYLTARKQVGREHGKVFPIKLSKLWERSGSAGEVSKFRYKVKLIATEDQLPEYRLEWKGDASRDGLLLMTRR